jgi:hypothetical protein
LLFCFCNVIVSAGLGRFHQSLSLSSSKLGWAHTYRAQQSLVYWIILNRAKLPAYNSYINGTQKCSSLLYLTCRCSRFPLPFLLCHSFAHSLCYLVPLLLPLFLPPLLLHFPLLSICDLKQDQTASTTTASTFFTIIIIIIIKNRDGILESLHKQNSISHLFR